MNLNAPFSIDPTVWGPHLWASIHTLALKADADYEVEPYLQFLNSLLFLLPCDSCRLDFNKYFANHESPVVGEAFHWSIDLHNHVNKKLGKKTLSMDEARAQWTNSNCSYQCTKAFVKPIEESFGSIYTFVAAAVLLVFIYLLYKRK